MDIDAKTWNLEKSFSLYAVHVEIRLPSVWMGPLSLYLSS